MSSAWPMPKGRDLAGVVVCTQCINDETVKGITFDGSGVCTYCRTVEALRKEYATGTPDGEARLMRIVETVKKAGRGKRYDCIVGVTGGPDSSYVLLKAVEW